MNLLVTGAGGFIAKNFINYSLKRNLKITAISRREILKKFKVDCRTI